ncbi:MAG: hypothetical protein IJ217_00010 [Clostridia bacterium]|nr:hypothetical protein [Clostridia bacterium]
MKKIISICLILLVLTLGFGVFATDDYEPRNPKLMIEEFTTLPTVNAGENLSLILKIMNTSKFTASDVTITPNFENTPLVYEKPVIVTLDNSIRTKKYTEVTFTFKVSETAKVGVYAIPFKLQYNNIYDQIFTTEQNVYFKVVKENAPALLTVNNIKTSLETIHAKDQFTLSFDINNVGDLDAKNMKVTLTGLSKDEFIALDSEDLKYIGTINGNDSQTVSFHLNTSKDITTGTHSLTVDISYVNTNGETVSESKNIYITNVVGSKTEEEPTTTDGGTPKVMIGSYSTNPTSIKAGDTINFTFRFTNTNASKTIKNMKITVDSTEGAFMIAKGSNTFYVERMSPKTTISKSIELNVKQDLTSKSYPINISFDYEDTKGVNYTSTEVINLPVTEYSKLVINSVYVGEAYVGGNTSLSFDYVNMGRATVSNLTASVEGDYTSVQSINYIGNLNTGTSDYYDIEVTPTKEGENYGTLVLAFEDSSGKIIEVRKEFQGYGMTQIIPDFPDEPMPYEPVIPDNQNNVLHLSAWTIIGIGAATLVVSFFLTKIIATKIIMKKLENEI